MHGIKKEGILGTIFFHFIIILLLFLIKLYVGSNSAGEGVLLLDFEEAGGSYKNYEQKVVKQPEVSDSKEEKILTQDYEEAPVFKENIKEKKRKEEVVNKVKSNEIVEEEKTQVDQRRLFRKDLISDKSSTGLGDGTSNTEGSGSGTGGYGNTNESSGGEGIGMSYSLEGRGKIYLHEPPKIFTTSGIVVVEIIVDRDGNVISAREGVKGTTTTDPMLLKLAKEAALKSKFTPNNDAPIHQKGTITYYFKLK